MRQMSDERELCTVATLLESLPTRKLPLIAAAASIEEVVEAMLRFSHSRLLYVIDQDERLVGTISLGRLIRNVYYHNRIPQIHSRAIISMLTATSAEDIMQTSPITTTMTEEIAKVLRRMIELNIKEIAVVNNEKRVIGDLTIIDLLRFIREPLPVPPPDLKSELSHHLLFKKEH